MLGCTQGIKHSIINLRFFIKQVISVSRHYFLLFYVFGGSIDRLRVILVLVHSAVLSFVCFVKSSA